MKEPKVSVVVITYNQEKYILQAIDSITMQKTDFPFELIIGIDKSPDNTSEILNKYKNKNKSCDIKIINREKNLGATRNMYELLKICKGKYIAFLEGDDYWSHNQKLQIQHDFLESHLEYSGIVHDANDVNDDGTLIMKHSEHYHLHKKIVNFKRCERGHLDFHLNTLMCRNVFKDKDLDFSILYKGSSITGDLVIPLFITDSNPIFVMNAVMSCYRYAENRYNDTFLDHTIKMLELEKRVNGWKLKKHKIDYSIKIANTIVLCIITAILKPEKNLKHKYKELGNYLNLKIFFYCILEFVTIPIQFLSYKIVKPKKK